MCTHLGISRQCLACAVESNPRGAGPDAKSDGGFGRCQPLPFDEEDEFPVIGGEAVQRRSYGALEMAVIGVGICFRLGCQVFGGGAFVSLASPVCQKESARCAEQPGSSQLGNRQFALAPPGRGEDLPTRYSGSVQVRRRR